MNRKSFLRTFDEYHDISFICDNSFDKSNLLVNSSKKKYHYNKQCLN